MIRCSLERGTLRARGSGACGGPGSRLQVGAARCGGWRGDRNADIALSSNTSRAITNGCKSSVGVQGDGRTYGHPVVLRPVTSEDAMTADWTRLPYDVLARISNRITNSVPEVNRVVLDCTSKPPGTIEWE